MMGSMQVSAGWASQGGKAQVDVVIILSPVILCYASIELRVVEGSVATPTLVIAGLRQFATQAIRLADSPNRSTSR